MEQNAKRSQDHGRTQKKDCRRGKGVTQFSNSPSWYANTLDSRQFDDMLHHLAELTGADLEKVIKSETASILGKTLQKTGVSTAKLVTAKYTYKDNGKGSENAFTIPYVRLNGRKVRTRSIKRKGMWVQQKKGKVWKPNKVNPDWRKLQDELKRLLARAKSRRGLSKATWLRVAHGAGIKELKPKPPAYVTKALQGFTSRLKSSNSGKVVKEKAGKVLYIQVKNYSTTAMAPKSKKGPGGFAAFKQAMRGRVDHFNYSLAKGTFDNVEKMARKYPGLKLTPVKR